MAIFVSSISFYGRPILPPLITDELRANIYAWRNVAVEKENRKTGTDKKLAKEQYCVGVAASTEDENSLEVLLDNQWPLSTASSNQQCDDEENIAINLSTPSTVDAPIDTQGQDDYEPQTAASATPTPTIEVENGGEVSVEKTTLLRSNSFVVETPSEALTSQRPVVEEKANTASPSSSPSPSPSAITVASTPISDTRCQRTLAEQLSSLCSSPVISQQLSAVLLSQELDESARTRGYEDTSKMVEEQLSSFQEMETLLKSFHELQVEELEFRQREEIDRLLKQKGHLQMIIQPADDIEESIRAAEDFHNCKTITETLPRSKLCALAKGWQVRRLMKCDRPFELKITVKEIREQLSSLKLSSDQSDIRFEKMIKNQLINAKNELWNIFHGEDSAKLRVKLLDRQKVVEKARRESRQLKLQSRCSPRGKKMQRRRLSEATRKSLARKGQTAASTSSHSSVCRSPRVAASRLRNRREPSYPYNSSSRTSHAVAGTGRLSATPRARKIRYSAAVTGPTTGSVRSRQSSCSSGSSMSQRPRDTHCSMDALKIPLDKTFNIDNYQSRCGDYDPQIMQRKPWK